MTARLTRAIWSAVGRANKVDDGPITRSISIGLHCDDPTGASSCSAAVTRYVGNLPVRIRRYAQAADAEMRPGPPRGPHRRQRAVPAGADGSHPRVLHAQARQAAGAEGAHEIVDEVHRRDLRHHGLPGAGHADRARPGRHPAPQAYTLIKAISKKKQKRHRRGAPDGSSRARQARRGSRRRRRNELFDLILKFAGYGFNKSHSTGYAIIAYQTAYLKTYFPAQYMAAVLTYESGARKIEDWAPYLEDCQQDTVFPDHAEELPARRASTVLPPDLNRSRAAFSVVFDDGEPRDAPARAHPVRSRRDQGRREERDRRDHRGARRGGPFASLFDFCERVSLVAWRTRPRSRRWSRAARSMRSTVSRQARAAVLAAIDDAIDARASKPRTTAEAARCRSSATAAEAETEASAPSNAGPPEEASARSNVAAVGPDDDCWPPRRRRSGIHVSGHPLDHARGDAASSSARTTRARSAPTSPTTPSVGPRRGILTRIRLTTVKQRPQSAGREDGDDHGARPASAASTASCSPTCSPARRRTGSRTGHDRAARRPRRPLTRGSAADHRRRDRPTPTDAASAPGPLSGAVVRGRADGRTGVDGHADADGRRCLLQRGGGRREWSGTEGRPVDVIGAALRTGGRRVALRR